jgi:uncharacterized protein YciI
MEDDPARAHLRQELLDVHVAYLNAHQDKIVLGGAQLREDGTTRHGSVLILNVKSLADAEAFVREEPYAKAGLFRTQKISRMRRAAWNPQNAPATPDGN